MSDEDLPGPIVIAVLNAIHRGALGSCCAAARVPALRGDPAAESRLHEILDRCEGQALVRSRRQRGERRYVLTHKGRALLRTQRRFALALATLLARSDLTA